MDNFELLHDILDYIALLKRDYGLNVSFRYHHLPLKYNDILRNVSHDNPYCSFVKFNDMRHCLLCQKTVVNGGAKKPYFGTCHAGVGEYVFPVISEDKMLSFISVSGYKSDLVNWKNVCRRVGADEKILREKYERLEDVVPPVEKIRPLIIPLVYMLRFLFENETTAGMDDEPNSKIVFNAALGYIFENYKTNLHVSDISRYLNYSQCFVSRIFKKYAGVSVGAYITKLKLKEAAFQLTHSDKKIIDIAYDLGFGDSNYFSNKFRAFYGKSPRAYRAEKASTET